MQNSDNVPGRGNRNRGNRGRGQYRSQDRNQPGDEHFSQRGNRGRWRYRSQDRSQLGDEHFSQRGGNQRNIPTRGNPNHNFNRNRDGLQDRRPQRGPTRMGFRKIEGLLEKGAEDIIFELSDSRLGFVDLLKDQKMSDDMKVLVVKLLHKLCECSFNSNVISIFQTVLNSPFHTTLIAYISTLDSQDPKEKAKNRCLWDDPDSFWNNVITVTRKIYDLLPEYSSAPVLKILKAAKAVIPRIEEEFCVHVSDSIKNDIDTLCKGIKCRIEEEEEKKAALVKNSDNKEIREHQPPNDYRDIDVYPSPEEVTKKDYRPFLRRNKVEGAYPDVYDYLDTQYRLLREDFVKPMRDGICQYIENPKARQDGVKVYQHVHFLNMETISDTNCFRIQFKSDRKKKINYENSKRFIFGSLVCFTADDFRTVLFAKIAKRDLKDLNKEQVIVGFHEDVILPKNIYELDFTMVESTVYFEPYYQVLNVLKTIDHQHFPMERYIIGVSTAARAPTYLMSIDPVFYDIEGDLVCPLNWNDERFFDFNDSQNEAYKAALSRELAIIQGPPGTGKTYLGLRIARTLLTNSSGWYRNSPMLVVCYTNHALDQFLEGLLPVTTDLIRVGGRSKSEALNEFNINNRRRGNLKPAALEKKHECSGILKKVDELDFVLNIIDQNNTVIDFGLFEDVVPNLITSWFNRVTKNDIIEWMIHGCHVDWNNGPTENEMQVGQLHEANDSNDEMELEVNINREEEYVLLDDLDIDKKPTSNTSQKHWQLIAVDDLRKEIFEKREVLRHIVNSEDLTDFEKYIRQDALEFEITDAEHKIRYLQEKLGQRDVYERQGLPEFVDLDHPHRMSPDDRWKLYFYWLNLYVQSLKDEKEKLCVEFRRNYRLYNEMRDMDDAQLMKSAKVVGMTTSGAARLHSSLRALKSPIVIVEEAAEVPESHIVAALTTECQHLILIGDHQQLKPSTADYIIETKFALGISLFERMVINHVQCFQLNIQHRMRPEISKLICPTIYPNLQDHESTLDRPQIKGVEQSLFFIDHQVQEQLCSDRTKKNEHEAKFLIALARHLILNGYEPDQITILAAYLGQMYEMKREKSRHACLSDVRIAVLDNYQGEESDIILLSLVRSNEEKNIGFLKIENRVCVALSRARNGMYVMGNMSQLVARSTIWSKINETFKQQNAIGPSLTLRCAVHTFKITHVAKAEDFSQVLEGGCNQPCNGLMACGHVCQRLCHVQDRQHTETKCIAKCNKLLCDDETHLCQKLCYEKCGPCRYPVSRTLDCGHTVNIECHINVAEYKCVEIVKSVQLSCGHITDKMCYMDVKKVRCPHPCEVRVEPCGHACRLTCHVDNDPAHEEYKCMKPCEKPLAGCKLSQGENDEVVHKCPQMCYEECGQCTIIEQKERSCGHRFKIQCYLDVEEVDCSKPCRQTLLCGHKCPNKCNEPCGGCKVLLEKKIPDCGHSVKLECSASPERRVCKSDCERLLPCGHRCPLKCRNDCLSKCQEIVECGKNGPCGHVIRSIRCYLMNTADQTLLYSACDSPCVETLKCGHLCSGTCGKCHQGRAHFRCQQPCPVTLICGHPCAVPCRQACRPCEKKCEYRCPHSNCSRKCGDPCTPCREKCLRRCQHQQCNRLCSTVCSVPACREPCSKKKRCGHPCVGFCGDPCPRLCRICDKEELTEVFFGTEEEEDARFVQLNDCGHILEANGLDQWMATEDEEGRTQVTVKACPKCKTPIKTTLRYNELVKQNMKDITTIKGKYYGSEKQIKSLKEELLTLLYRLVTLEVMLDPYGGGCLLTKLAAVLQRNPKNRQQSVNLKGLDAIKLKLSLLERLQPAAKIRRVDCTMTNLPLILDILEREEYGITDQEVEDVNLEIDRFLRFSQFLDIQNKMRGGVTPAITKKTDEILAALKSHSRYDENQDRLLKEKLLELNKLAETSVILTDAEKKEIVRAMGLAQGHWFKCPNGHPYCITECGGAMQVSKCPECGVQIGGTNHHLLPNQQLATDFDGARHPAWSNATNILNYDLRRLN